MMQTRYKVVILLLIFLQSIAYGQTLVGFSSAWNYEFHEWHFFTHEEEQIGYMQLRWPMQDDWTEWDFRIGEAFGSLRMKFKDNPNVWELRAGNELIELRTVWQNDFRQWQVTNGSERFDIKSRYTNIFEEWIAEDNNSSFYMYTAYEGDVRDWIIEDNMPEISFNTKLAMSFIPILYLIPK